eukprot:1137047-Pelagomonas_calceolata.AAC.1
MQARSGCLHKERSRTTPQIPISSKKPPVETTDQQLNSFVFTPQSTATNWHEYCHKYCHELASIERVWSRALT